MEFGLGFGFGFGSGSGIGFGFGSAGLHGENEASSGRPERPSLTWSGR